jgi:hypothetical protein
MLLGANACRTIGRDTVRAKAVRAGRSFHLSTVRETDTFKNSSLAFRTSTTTWVALPRMNASRAIEAPASTASFANSLCFRKLLTFFIYDDETVFYDVKVKPWHSFALERWPLMQIKTVKVG